MMLVLIVVDLFSIIERSLLRNAVKFSKTMTELQKSCGLVYILTVVLNAVVISSKIVYHNIVQHNMVYQNTC